MHFVLNYNNCSQLVFDGDGLHHQSRGWWEGVLTSECPHVQAGYVVSDWFQCVGREGGKEEGRTGLKGH